MIQFELEKQETVLMAAYYFFITNSNLIKWNLIGEESYLYLPEYGNVARFNSVNESFCKEIANNSLLESLVKRANRNRSRTGFNFVLQSCGTGTTTKLLRMDEIDPNYLHHEGWGPSNVVPCIKWTYASDMKSETYVFNELMSASDFAGTLLQLTLKARLWIF